MGAIIRSPILCSFAWTLSIYQLNYLSNFILRDKSKKNKKKILILYRAYGINDFEYIIKDKKNDFDFLFFPRKNIKIIYNNFFSNLDEKLNDDNYVTDNQKINNAKQKYKEFLKKILKFFKKQNKLNAIISFNFRYYSEKELHSACKELGFIFIVCQKESLILKSEKDSYIKINSKNGKFNGHYMTVYTEDYKNLLVQSGIVPQIKFLLLECRRFLF